MKLFPEKCWSHLLAAVFILNALPISAQSVSSNAQESKFFLRTTEDNFPYLVGSFSGINGFSQTIKSGAVYFSCYPGRLDTFRLNFILKTVLSEYYAESQKIFVGLRNSTEMRRIVIISAPTDELDAPPLAFEFNSSIAGFAYDVLPYDKYGVSDFRRLYVSSYPNASFFEQLKRNNRLVLVAYISDERRFEIVMELYYSLTEETAKKFVISCIDS